MQNEEELKRIPEQGGNNGMRGDEIFDALTDIDDELIERAMNYYPQKKKNMRLAAGIKLKAVVNIAAAMIIVCVGAYIYNNVFLGSTGTSISNEAAFDMSDEIEMENAQTELTGMAASGTDIENNGVFMNELQKAVNENSDNIPDEAKYTYEFTAQSDAYVRIGEYEGMSVLMLSEELSKDLETYSIYVEKDDEILPAEEAQLSEEQLLQIQKMAAEYCENNR